MAWFCLIAAGILEILWAYALKQSAGFTRLLPTVTAIGAMIVSFALLSIAMRTLPLGTAYMIWTGIGAIGAFAVGVLALGEPADSVRLFAAALILAGMLLMKLATAG